MRLCVIETLYERAALSWGLILAPLLNTFVALRLANAVIAGAGAGVFDALEGGGPATAEITKSCGTDPAATERLLRALCACGYLNWRYGAYTLTRVSRRWLLRTSPRLIGPSILHRNLRFMRFEDYLQRGTPQDVHGSLGPEDWELYHLRQVSRAGLIVREVVNLAPLPESALLEDNPWAVWEFRNFPECLQITSISKTCKEPRLAIWTR
jgi:hypothetical protein